MLLIILTFTCFVVKQGRNTGLMMMTRIRRSSLSLPMLQRLFLAVRWVVCTQTRTVGPRSLVVSGLVVLTCLCGGHTGIILALHGTTSSLSLAGILLPSSSTMVIPNTATWTSISTPTKLHSPLLLLCFSLSSFILKAWACIYGGFSMCYHLLTFASVIFFLKS